MAINATVSYLLIHHTFFPDVSNWHILLFLSSATRIEFVAFSLRQCFCLNGISCVFFLFSYFDLMRVYVIYHASALCTSLPSFCFSSPAISPLQKRYLLRCAKLSFNGLFLFFPLVTGCSHQYSVCERLDVRAYLLLQFSSVRAFSLSSCLVVTHFFLCYV